MARDLIIDEVPVNFEMPIPNAFITTLRQSVAIYEPGKHNVAEKWCFYPRSLSKLL